VIKGKIKVIKKVFISCIGVVITTSIYAGKCDAYLQEAKAASGVVPNIKNGKLKSLSIYGQKSFIAPKSSLINKARRKAEMSAKRDFSAWIKEKVSSNTLSQELMETHEKTNSDGTTEGIAEEISKYSDEISNSTESVLSGIIKLDECVDPQNKIVYVRVGWKPELSEMAADTRANIDNSVERGKNGQTRNTSSRNKLQPAKGYRIKSEMADDF
jgi:hypothetical protein